MHHKTWQSHYALRVSACLLYILNSWVANIANYIFSIITQKLSFKSEQKQKEKLSQKLLKNMTFQVHQIVLSHPVLCKSNETDSFSKKKYFSRYILEILFMHYVFILQNFFNFFYWRASIFWTTDNCFHKKKKKSKLFFYIRTN